MDYQTALVIARSFLYAYASFGAGFTVGWMWGRDIKQYGPMTKAWLALFIFTLWPWFMVRWSRHR